MTELAVPLFCIALLVIASAFFSGTEVSMFALRRVDRETLVRSSRSRDSLVLNFLNQPRKLIATILIGNESVNVSLATVMASVVNSLFPGQSETSHALLATALALPTLLFLGEITPKTIAMKAPLAWASRAVRVLWVFGIIVTPIRIVVRAVAELIVLPFGKAGAKSAFRDLSEAEFRALVDAGNAEGQVNARERRMIHKVFEFGDKTVAEAMIPRNRVFALSYDLPMPRLVSEVAARGFSRIPIYQKSLDDHVRGILYAKDLVVHETALATPRRLSDLLHEPLFVPQTTRLERLFRLFKQKKTHMALVVNEYGKIAGLVTLDDVLSQLLGELRPGPELNTGPTGKISPSDMTPSPVASSGGGEPAEREPAAVSDMSEASANEDKS